VQATSTGPYPPDSQGEFTPARQWFKQILSDSRQKQVHGCVVSFNPVGDNNVTHRVSNLLMF
jgi:hypothetical protein